MMIFFSSFVSVCHKFILTTQMTMICNKQFNLRITYTDAAVTEEKKLKQLLQLFGISFIKSYKWLPWCWFIPFFFCKILCMIWLLAKSRLKIVNETIRWSNDVFKTLFYKLISVNRFRNGELLAPIPTFQLGFQKYFRFDIYFHIIDVLKQKVSLYKTAATICRYNKANIVSANIFLTEKKTKSIYKWININKFTNCYGV